MIRYPWQLLVDSLALEHPDWSRREVEHQALLLKRELKRLEMAEYRSNKRYYDHTWNYGLDPHEPAKKFFRQTRS